MSFFLKDLGLNPDLVVFTLGHDLNQCPYQYHELNNSSFLRVVEHIK